MVDTRDLKSLDHCGRAGSSPASSTHCGEVRLSPNGPNTRQNLRQHREAPFAERRHTLQGKGGVSPPTNSRPNNSPGGTSNGTTRRPSGTYLQAGFSVPALKCGVTHNPVPPALATKGKAASRRRFLPKWRRSANDASIGPRRWPGGGYFFSRGLSAGW